MTMRRWIGRLAAVLIGVAAVGCGETPVERLPGYVRAQRALLERDYPAAIANFEQLLRLRPASAAVHLELAQLYDEQLREPFRAAWHYREYLRLAPESPEWQVVRALERRSQRAALDRWLLDPETPGPEAVLDADPGRMRQELLVLRRENARLRTELLLRGDAVAPPPEAAPEPEPVPAPEAVAATATVEPRVGALAAAPSPTVAERTYKVESGDSPAKISRKMYGTTRYANLILAANRDTVKSERGLQIGQILKIPPKPEE